MTQLDVQFLPNRPCAEGSCGSFLSASSLAAQILMSSLKSQKSMSSSVRFRDLEDIQRAQQGDQDAFRRLVEGYQAHIARLLWRFTRDKTDHEELIQETFVQAYFSLHTYQTQAPFEHWLSRIATRVGYRHWKQAKRHAHASILDSDCDWQQIVQHQDTMSPEQAAELIHTMLTKLPPRDRLVLTLRYLEQCSVEQTAQRTGWSESLVKVQTYRAKQKLKKLFEKNDIEIEMPK